MTFTSGTIVQANCPILQTASQVRDSHDRAQILALWRLGEIQNYDTPKLYRILSSSNPSTRSNTDLRQAHPPNTKLQAKKNQKLSPNTKTSFKCFLEAPKSPTEDCTGGHHLLFPWSASGRYRLGGAGAKGGLWSCTAWISFSDFWL